MNKYKYGYNRSNKGLAPQYLLRSPNNQWLPSANITGWNSRYGIAVMTVDDDNPVPTGNEGLFYYGDDADITTNSFYIEKITTGGGRWRHAAFVSSSNVALIDLVSTTTNTRYHAGRHKIAFGWDRDNGKAWFFENGILTCYYEGTIPEADGICIGGRESDVDRPYGETIEKFEYYNVRPTENLLRQVTRNVVFDDTITNTGVNTLVGFGESTVVGYGGVIYPMYSKSSNIKLIGNDWAIGNYADPWDDTTNAVLTYLNDTTTELGYAGHTINGLANATDQDWAAMPACKGGTTVAQNWLPNAAAGGWDKVSVNEAHAAIIQAKAAQMFGSVKAVWIGLGINDADQNTTEGVYKNGMTDFVSELRGAMGINVPVVIMGMHAWDAAITAISESEWNTTNGWNEDLAGTIPNASFVDNSAIAGEAGDERHYSAAGNVTAGANLTAGIQAVI